jgi:hypothetical protein
MAFIYEGSPPFSPMLGGIIISHKLLGSGYATTVHVLTGLSASGTAALPQQDPQFFYLKFRRGRSDLTSVQ